MASDWAVFYFTVDSLWPEGAWRLSCHMLVEECRKWPRLGGSSSRHRGSGTKLSKHGTACSHVCCWRETWERHGWELAFRWDLLQYLSQCWLKGPLGESVDDSITSRAIEPRPETQAVLECGWIESYLYINIPNFYQSSVSFMVVTSPTAPGNQFQFDPFPWFLFVQWKQAFGCPRKSCIYERCCFL